MAAPSNLINPKKASIVSRYFDVSLFVLILTGFVTLVSTGKLDLLWTVVVSLALLYRAILLLRGKHHVLAERWISYLSVAYIPFYAIDYFGISRSFLSATVHMVLFSMLLKIFSVQRDRDHIYLAILSFLMVLSAALLTVDVLFLAVFFVFMLLAVTTFMSMEMKRSANALVRPVTLSESKTFRRSLSLFGVLMVFAIVLCAAVIFFVLPRVSAGYLTAFAPRNDLVTGFSENVRLGDIGQIKQSSTVVMHVQFTDGKVPFPDLKWRGVGLGTFDGRRWYNPIGNLVVANYTNGHLYVGPHAFDSDQSRKTELRLARGFSSYRIVMEPIATNVFFLATDPYELIGNYREVALDQAGSVFNNDRERAVTVYQGRSTIPFKTKLTLRESTPLDSAMFVTYLQLPVTDPRVTELSRKITSLADNDFDRASGLETYLRTHYGYTLELPSTQVADPLANFLFERKKGHCEYFASAMAIMLRTIGIPSRVVNGFRNGQYNDLTGSYIIRASDAHSWVEAFISGYGWITFDPTPPDPLHETNVWSRMMLYADAGREFWREWVINYDYRRRETLGQETTVQTRRFYYKGLAWLKSRYKKLIAMTHHVQDGLTGYSWAIKINKLFILFGLLIAVLLAFIFILVLRHRKNAAAKCQADTKQAASLWYRKMTTKIAPLGWTKLPNQTPQEFVLSIEQPEIRLAVATFTRHYERARFADSTEDADVLPQLYEEISLPS